LKLSDSRRRLICAITICAALVLSSVEGLARPSWTDFYSASASDAAKTPGTLLKYQVLRLPAFYRAKAWRILYSTRDYRDRPLISSGTVILPAYAAAKPSDRTIVAWAHPTVGIARQCAPTLRKSPTASILGLNDLVASGHIVAATDYPGLGTLGPIGYLVGKGQAHAVIDSVRAARQIPEVGGGSRYALWGYSQGAHAALFSALLSKFYAPELRLVGVAAAAPPTDLSSLLAANINTLEGRILTSFALGSWSWKYGLALGSLITPATEGVVRSINQNCIDDLSGQLDTLAAQKPLEQQFLLRNPQQVPGWSAVISENSLYSLTSVVPAIVFQGDIDGIVRSAITQRFVRTSCHNGAAVKLVTLRGRGHGATAKDSAATAIGWINDRFRGKPAPSSCR
jgi:hypothetical protein